METQNQNGSTALARIGAVALDPYTPRDIGEAMTLAKTYAASKILGAYGDVNQVMLVMATGSELGIPPTAALRGLYVVEGRIFMSSDLMVALCMRAPQCERFDLTEQTETSAAYTVQRKGGQPLVFRFTVDDAKRAQLGGKDGNIDPKSNWAKYPGTMCRHRAAALAARAVFPDVIMGLYDEAEREEVTGRDVTPLPSAPAAVPRAPAPPVDAEVVDDNEPRIVRALETAADKPAVDAIAKEALKIWPQARPKAVSEAHAAAKKRVAEAAINAAATIASKEEQPQQQAAAEPPREPGEDG